MSESVGVRVKVNVRVGGRTSEGECPSRWRTSEGDVRVGGGGVVKVTGGGGGGKIIPGGKNPGSYGRSGRDQACNPGTTVQVPHHGAFGNWQLAPANKRGIVVRLISSLRMSSDTPDDPEGGPCPAQRQRSGRISRLLLRDLIVHVPDQDRRQEV